MAVETAKTASFFGIDPKVAVLSFSTYGSGKGGTVQLSHDAVIEARNIDPDLVIDGEFQFDAAVSAEVAKTKCPDSKVAGQANTFIFPLIEAGNIGYKIAQRLGGYEAYGPILQGLNAPINDLSAAATPKGSLQDGDHHRRHGVNRLACKRKKRALLRGLFFDNQTRSGKRGRPQCRRSRKPPLWSAWRCRCRGRCGGVPPPSPGTSFAADDGGEVDIHVVLHLP